MHLIEQFGHLSGFAINWYKSALLPLDPLPAPLTEDVSQIQVVTLFRYLGIIVTGDP